MYQTASNHGKGDLAAFTAQSTMLLTTKASGVVLDFPSRVSLFYPVGDTVDCQVKRSTRCPIRFVLTWQYANATIAFVLINAMAACPLSP